MDQVQNKKTKAILYLQSLLRRDLLAAFTVAMVAVPQSMAYAAIAGVNPVYGLYSAIIPAIVASIFGSSNHVVTGPTNTITLATSGVLVAVMAEKNYPEYVFVIAILSGVFMLLLGVLKLGILIRYVSNAVLSGFLAGAAGLIILNQLPKLLGLSSPSDHNLFEIASYIIKNITNTNALVLVMGVGTILFLLLAKRLFPKLPAAMVVVFVSTLLVISFRWQEKGVLIIGEMAKVGIAGMKFHIPDGVWRGSNC